jgi:hypothetical protein
MMMAADHHQPPKTITTSPPLACLRHHCAMQNTRAKKRSPERGLVSRGHVGSTHSGGARVFHMKKPRTLVPTGARKFGVGWVTRALRPRGDRRPLHGTLAGLDQKAPARVK